MLYVICTINVVVIYKKNEMFFYSEMFCLPTISHAISNPTISE